MSERTETDRDWSLRANAALDGELDAAHAFKFEQDLESDPALRAAFGQLKSARDALRALAPEDRAPDALRARVLALADEVVREPRRAARGRWQGYALAASLAIVAFVGGYAGALHLRSSSSDPELQALVAGFARGQVSGQPFDVASSDRHTVKPWLSARVTLGAAVVDLAEQGYPLAGGQIDIVGRAPVPTLVYRRREHFISVSELPLGDGSAQAAPAQAAQAQAAQAQAALDGYHIERWSDAERAYVAVSDVDAADLAAFAEAFRRAQRAAGGSATPGKP